MMGNDATTMKRLTFVQALGFIDDEIAEDGFTRAVGGIYRRENANGMSLWMSITGNDYTFSPTFGVFSGEIDRVVNVALRGVLPTFRASKPGVPLFRLTPERLSPGDTRIITRRASDTKYLKEEILQFVELLRDTCYPFLEAHCSFQSALDLALKWNKFDQAQIYYIPALMLLLGLNEQQKHYVNEVVDSLPTEAEGVVEMYLKYVAHLERALLRRTRRAD